MLPTETTHRAFKGLQTAAVFAALCTTAVADNTPAVCPIAGNIPVWGTTYNGQVLCFVGTDPRNGPGLSFITTPVIPIKLRYIGPSGSAEISDPTAPTANPKLSALDAVLDSPIFVAQDFPFGGTSVGTAQWIEATLRASFWKYSGAKFDNWHVRMVPLRYAALTVDVPYGDWSFDKSSPQMRVVTGSEIEDAIASQFKSESGYKGYVPIFLAYNVKEPGVGGYHRHYPNSDGSLTPYIFASYNDPPYTTTDVHALSHEVAEFAHDPFGSNATPWPKVSPPWNPPYDFKASDCQSNLEVGDPTENQPSSGKDITFSNSTMTYNFDNIALASWFMQASHSFSVNAWYTLNGPIDGQFGAPAAACPTVPGSPQVKAINPNSGSAAGGNPVTVTGEALSQTDKFNFGDSPATRVSCTYASPTTCTMVTPSQAAGPVDLVVKSSVGDSQGVVFTYLVSAITTIKPASGPLEGVATVTVNGSALSKNLEFDFDGVPATMVDCPDQTACTVVTPYHKPGTVKVVIKQFPGTSATYSYLSPAIKSFDPKVGPTAGGMAVGISGDSLSDKMTVNFGPYSTSQVDCRGSSTDCVVISPAVPLSLSMVGGMGPVPLTITVDGFTSAPSKDSFTFAPFPTITLLSPGSGTTGTPVVISGTNFSTVAGKTTFTFSGVPATGVNCTLSTTCTAVVPGMATQTVYVLVTVDGHTSLTGAVFTNTARLPPPPPR